MHQGGSGTQVDTGDVSGECDVSVGGIDASVGGVMC